MRGGAQGEAAAFVEPDEEELARRAATKDGKPVVTIRAMRRGLLCTVECDVYPVNQSLRVDPLSTGPYTFGTPVEATSFVDEAVQALRFLGCDIA